MGMRRFMQSTIANGAGEPLFFDTFSGGLGGFSFRKLVSSYSGRWGRAINITTLEERDIGFVGNVADTADIEDLSNGTDTVELLEYDNSFISIYFQPNVTNGRPILVSSGTLVTLNSLPAFDFSFNRVLMSLDAPPFQLDFSPVSVFSLGKIDTLRQRNLSVATTLSRGYFHGGTLAGYDGIGLRDTPGNVASLTGEDLNRRLATYYWDATTLKIASNGSALTSFAGLEGSFDIRHLGLGAIATAQSFSGKIQEVLFFSTNKEADDADIRTNINDYYSIY